MLRATEGTALAGTQKESIEGILHDYVTLERPLGASETGYYFGCKPNRKEKTYKLAKKAFGNTQRIRRAFQLYHLLRLKLWSPPK